MSTTVTIVESPAVEVTVTDENAVAVNVTEQATAVTVLLGGGGGGPVTISDLMTTDLLASDLTIPTGKSMVYPNLQVASGVTVDVAGSLIVL